MKTIIWGSRGSLPASFNAATQRKKIYSAIETAVKFKISEQSVIDNFINEKLPFAVRGAYGVNTSCVEIRDENAGLIFDAGTGLRDYGNSLMKNNAGTGEFNIFISHLHWDHIQGFPFFLPAYIKGNKINIYGCHENLSQAFKNQQQPLHFPVAIEQMAADMEFIKMSGGREYDIAGFRITALEQNHPGKSYGYRIERNGRKIVYSTDSEHTNETPDAFLDFISGADLLIFDSQYSLSDALYVKENWGHSSNMTGVELSLRAGVKKLCLFHTEPTDDDEKLDAILLQTRKYVALSDPSSRLHIDMAYEGLEITV